MLQANVASFSGWIAGLVLDKFELGKDSDNRCQG